jgi:cytochrome c oxidase subunit 2
VLFATRPGGAENLSIFDPVSPPAESIRDLSILVLVITGLIFLVVEGILLYVVVRFRRRAATGAEPPQVYGSKPIEIAWTALPGLIVVVLVLVTTRTLWEVTPDPPAPRPGDNTLFVTVVGRQWWWEYRYDHYNGRKLDFITANELHVPACDPGEKGVKRPVYLRLESADVIHSFWVPRLAGKMDLIPGRTNSLWFQTDQPGLYLGQCAEYCGTQHAGMLLRVIVEPPEKFEDWLENQKKPAVEDPGGAMHLIVQSYGAQGLTPAGAPIGALAQRLAALGVMELDALALDPAARAGKARFLSLSCVNCHRIRGTSAKGSYAPDLTHLMSRKTLASGTINNDEANLRQWLRVPQKLRPGCLMPAFQLDDRELQLMGQYLRTLK